MKIVLVFFFYVIPADLGLIFNSLVYNDGLQIGFIAFFVSVDRRMHDMAADSYKG